MTNLTEIEAKYLEDIEQAALNFGDHEGLSKARVIRWIAQFDADDQGLAVSILRMITYYGASNIRAMVRELCRDVVNQFRKIKRREIAFVSLGEPGSSSEIILRALRGVREANNAQKLRMTDLGNVQGQRA